MAKIATNAEIDSREAGEQELRQAEAAKTEDDTVNPPGSFEAFVAGLCLVPMVRLSVVFVPGCV